MLVSRFEIEEREPASTGPIPFRTRECKRHLRRNCRREPLATVESIRVRARLLFRDCFGETNVGAARELRHPLTGSPKLFWIARDQVWHCPIDQSLVTGIEQRACGAVSHCEWTTVDIG